jgi:hypothetical protein
MKERKTDMNGVWVAIMESENYTWTGIGLTEDEAIEAIVKEWNEGSGSKGREPMTLDELQNWYGIGCIFIELGKCIWR